MHKVQCPNVAVTLKYEEANGMLTDQLLLEKANELLRLMGLVEPSADQSAEDDDTDNDDDIQQGLLSNGWLYRFKKRSGFVTRVLHGEAAAANETGVALSVTELLKILENSSPENVFNMDEAGLFFRQTVSDSVGTASLDQLWLQGAIIMFCRHVEH
jgi:hypothetical protein